MDITLNRIRIRDAVVSDCYQLADWWNDGTVMAHAGFPNGIGTTHEEVRSKIERECDDMGRTMIIEYCEHPIGEMSYRSMGDDIAGIGIKICDSNYQEKGLGKIILSLFIKELFSTRFRKVVLDTNLKNKRAQRVYESLGFQKMRINNDCWVDQMGEPQSSVDYELIPKFFCDYSVDHYNKLSRDI